MKKIIAVIAFSILLVACSSKKEGNMVVNGTIKGLKKGTLYLQKMKDTALISVDSVAILGEETFSLTDNVTSPVLYYLTFDGNTTDKRILFFGEEGSITINDDVSKFGVNPEITGSTNQDLLKKFNKIDSRFKTKRLEFIKNEFDARKANNMDSVAKLEAAYRNDIKRRYLQTINFALNHKDAAIAPYLALTELYDANIKYLDTINNALTKDVKNSVYGKQLGAYIKEIKENEKQ